MKPSNSITKKSTTFTLGEEVVYKYPELQDKKAYVCYGKFEAEIYTCYGWYIGDKDGKQLSEASIDLYWKPVKQN